MSHVNSVALFNNCHTCHNVTYINVWFSGSHSHYNMTTANHTPRFVARKKLHPNDSIGLTLVGGNAVGIFVRDVVPGSLLDGANGVQCGDQILQVLLLLCLSCSLLIIVYCT